MLYPRLDKGSGSKNEQPGRVASERRTGLLDGGPLTDNVVFISDQRVFALKRTAILRIEMLKQVQHDGFPDEERTTWTRSVGTKNRSSWRWPVDGQRGFHQRPAGFSLKRTAVLRIEMLKQVQHDGFPDEERTTWTRSDGTKNRSSWQWPVDGQRNTKGGLF